MFYKPPLPFQGVRILDLQGSESAYGVFGAGGNVTKLWLKRDPRTVLK